MSFLVIFTDADNILAATDTLAVTLTGEPHSFGTKSFYMNAPLEITATVYQLGFSEEDDSYRPAKAG